MKKERFLFMITLIFSLVIVSNTKAQSFDPTLTRLIKQSLENSHELKINDYKIKQTQIDRSKAYKTFLPHLELNASYTRLNDDIVLDPELTGLLMGTQKLLIKEALGLPFNASLPPNIPLTDIPPISDKNIIKSSADLQWVIFSGLEATYAVKATKHKEKALNYAGKITEKRIIKETVKTYDQLALVMASEKVLETVKKQLDAQEKKVQSAVKNGLAIKIDLKRIDLARQKLNIQKADIEKQKDLLRQKLQQLTGENSQTINRLTPDIKPFLIPETWLNAQNTSVELQSLNEAKKAKQYQEKMAYSKYIPKIAIKGHYEFIDDDLTLLNPKWYIGIGAKWQIFDGLKSYDKARQNKLEAEVYQEKIDQAKDLLQLAKTNAQMNYKMALQQIERYQKALDLAKETYHLTGKQYQNGLVSITEVLDALTQYQKANFNLQKAYFDQREAAIELLYRKDLLSKLIN